MIKAVFFDLYGTLAGFQPSRYEVQSEACSEFGIELTPEGVVRGYSDADEYMSRQNAIRPMRLMNEAERIRFFIEYEKKVLAGDNLDISTKLLEKIWLRIREIPYEMVLYQDAVETLEDLKSRNIILGMISNMDRNSADLTKSLGLVDYLNFGVTSLEVGVEKPDSLIFMTALSKAGCEPHDAVHVGDQLSSDVEGAMGVNITPVLIDRDMNHIGFDMCSRIERLSELPGLIKSLGGET